MLVLLSTFIADESCPTLKSVEDWGCFRWGCWFWHFISNSYEMLAVWHFLKSFSLWTGMYFNEVFSFFCSKLFLILLHAFRYQYHYKIIWTLTFFFSISYWPFCYDYLVILITSILGINVFFCKLTILLFRFVECFP